MPHLSDNNSAGEDRLIKKLFKESFVPEQPTPDFNQHVMDQVMYDWVLQADRRQSLLDKQSRYWLIPGVLLVLVMGYLIDMGRLGQQYVNKQVWFKGFSELGVMLFGWMESMHWIVPVSLIAIGGLLIFDRLLQRLSRH